jgi:hypothetical protein
VRKTAISAHSFRKGESIDGLWYVIKIADRKNRPP